MDVAAGIRRRAALLLRLLGAHFQASVTGGNCSLTIWRIVAQQNWSPTRSNVFVAMSAQDGGTKLETVNVSALEVGFQRTFGKFSSVLPEFDKINAAAYWDYQRSKVYVRTNKVIRQSLKKATKLFKKTVGEKEVMVDDRPGVARDVVQRSMDC